MISIFFGIVIGISLYLSVLYSIIELENLIIDFKYRNMQKYGEKLAFMIDDIIIKGGKL